MDLVLTKNGLNINVLMQYYNLKLDSCREIINFMKRYHIISRIDTICIINYIPSNITHIVKLDNTFNGVWYYKHGYTYDYFPHKLQELNIVGFDNTRRIDKLPHNIKYLSITCYDINAIRLNNKLHNITIFLHQLSILTSIPNNNAIKIITSILITPKSHLNKNDGYNYYIYKLVND